MKKALKAAFLSGLVFPGAGQVALKHYMRGAVFILAASAAVFVMIWKAVQNAFVILAKLQTDGGTIHLNEISNAATQASAGPEGFPSRFLLLFLIFCWVIATIDAYRIGRQKDLEEILKAQDKRG
ncbi:MAG: hypothetical protein Q8P24_00690 [Desulfobacterales bacterium]|nr:hypothetical protein [Desulfobacterales bacterium]